MRGGTMNRIQPESPNSLDILATTTPLFPLLLTQCEPVTFSNWPTGNLCPSG